VRGASGFARLRPPAAVPSNHTEITCQVLDEVPVILAVEGARVDHSGESSRLPAKFHKKKRRNTKCVLHDQCSASCSQ